MIIKENKQRSAETGVRQDVAVLGGGPSGAATALHLARRGWSVVMIEQSDYSRLRIGETLAPQIKPHLQSLGLWQRFMDGGPLPAYGVRSAWGSDELHDNPYIFSPYGMGWRIDRAVFDEMIAHAAADSGVAVYMRGHVKNCRRTTASGWHVDILHEGKSKSFNARFVVDATGRSSRFLGQLGSVNESTDRLVGIAAMFESEEDEHHEDLCTLIEASEHGWWYSGSIPACRVVVVYMTDLDLYVNSRRGGTDWWNRSLDGARHTLSRICRLHPVGRPRVFPSGSHQVRGATAPDWLPVGDAAIGMDPLCGNGITTALRTAACAAQRVDDHLRGDSNAVSEYLQDITVWFKRYLSQRRHFYSQEARWSRSPFWCRRQWNESWPS